MFYEPLQLNILNL